jgi:hypothetical protein
MSTLEVLRRMRQHANAGTLTSCIVNGGRDNITGATRLLALATEKTCRRPRGGHARLTDGASQNEPSGRRIRIGPTPGRARPPSDGGNLPGMEIDFSAYVADPRTRMTPQSVAGAWSTAVFREPRLSSLDMRAAKELSLAVVVGARNCRF